MANVLIDSGNLTSIASAIRQKNKSETTYKPSEMAAAIQAIDTDPSGDATATAADILSPKTAYARGAKLTGTCTYDADTRDANATSSDILLNKTGYVNGSKVTGTLANYDDTYIYLSSIAVTTPPTKTSYDFGDALDLTGMIITATYSDNSTEVVTDYTTVPANGAILSSSGNITITLNGKTCTQAFTVAAYQGLCFTANTAGSTVAMSITGTPTLNQNFSYSTGGAWQTFTPGTTTITLTNVGDKVYFKGDNPNGISESYDTHYNFVMTGSIAGSGNIMSLIDNGACNTLTIPNDYCFLQLFHPCDSLTSSPILPATTLTTGCYSNMLNGTSITVAPALPATTLARSCYLWMFANCSLLTIAPVLPATTVAVYSYHSMFYQCTSLTTPPALPATTLADNCYIYMFEGCTSLSTVPVLPAATLTDHCYDAMFYGCTALKVYSTSSEGHTYEWRIPTSGTGTEGTESLDDMLTNTSGDVTGTPIINTIYYVENTPV